MQEKEWLYTKFLCQQSSHSSIDTIESKASINTSKKKSSYPQKKRLTHSLLQICPLIVATIKANIHSQETGPHVQIER